ncbi:MAG: ATP-dependent DNA helicase RecQ, partial [Actinobacteria bacterium]|nr:ATP-dependent DNA helicase RecQ [Actinomycetota bacterium]
GRAGRAIDRAVVVLLSAHEDAAIWDYFVTASLPDPDEVARLLAVTPTDGAASVPALEAESGLRRTKVELMLKQLAVDGVVERTEAGWLRTGQDWIYDAAHYDGVIAVRRREADIMRDYASGRRCLMQLLQESLDDPTAAPCGRCSVCTGRLPDGLRASPSPEVTVAVASALRTRAHLVEPRKMWPGGAFGTRGRIAPGEMAAEGRALVHADAPEWRELIAQTFAADAEPSPELVDALVAALGAWRRSWPVRPEVIAGLPAAGFPALTAGLVHELAAIGRMEVAPLAIDDAAVRAARTSRGLTSAQEAAAWKDAITASDVVAGRAVLLVVDASSSLWPVTIAAAALRRAGASTVLPLLVHRRVG